MIDDDLRVRPFPLWNRFPKAVSVASLRSSCFMLLSVFAASAWLFLLPLPSEANMFSFISRWLWPLPSSANSGSSPPSPSRETKPSHTDSSVLPNSPLVTRSLKVTMGRCTAVHPVHGPCDCIEGFSVGNSHAVCDRCIHPMSFHNDYGKRFFASYQQIPVSSLIVLAKPLLLILFLPRSPIHQRVPGLNWKPEFSLPLENRCL